LVEIPFWWDFTKDSVAATIQQIRPELVAEPITSFPIPQECPSDKEGIHFRSVTEIEAHLPPLSHGQTWDCLQDLNGW